VTEAQQQNTKLQRELKKRQLEVESFAKLLTQAEAEIEALQAKLQTTEQENAGLKALEMSRSGQTAQVGMIANMKKKMQMCRKQLDAVMTAMRNVKKVNEELATKLADQGDDISQLRDAEREILQHLNEQLSGVSDELRATKFSQKDSTQIRLSLQKALRQTVEDQKPVSITFPMLYCLSTRFWLMFWSKPWVETSS
jgi:Mg2+ and Co2+ transporter CorA